MKTRQKLNFYKKVIIVQLALCGSVLCTWNVQASDTNAPLKKTSMEQESGVRVRKDARGRKVQYVDFGEALIEGKAKTPDGFVIQSRKSGKFDSLIELRRDFRDRISLNALESVTLTAPAD